MSKILTQRRGFLLGAGAFMCGTAAHAGFPLGPLMKDGQEVAQPAEPESQPIERTPSKRDIRERRLAMWNIHVDGDEIDLVFWRNGSFIEGALREINRFMRDWREGEQTAISTDLLVWLYRTQRELEVDQFGLISGFRTVVTNNMLSGTASQSLHLTGEAADVRALGHSVSQLAEAARAAGQIGGIGKYSRSNFVHLDTGGVRNWGA